MSGSENQEGRAPAGAPEVVTTFPAPPPFYRLYRPGSSYSPPPPPPVPTSTFKSFGEPVSTVYSEPVLEGEDIVEFGKDLPAIEALQRLRISTGRSFVRLVDALRVADEPRAANEREHLQRLLVNSHHRINCLRSREALAVIHERVDQLGSVARALRDDVEQARACVSRTVAAEASRLRGALPSVDVANEVLVQLDESMQQDDAAGEEELCVAGDLDPGSAALYNRPFRHDGAVFMLPVSADVGRKLRALACATEWS